MSQNPTKVQQKVVDLKLLFCYTCGMLCNNTTFFFNPEGNF